jgi:acyl CoA:acetate/3-ketoacid CoA transferase alpha subunit
MTTINIPDALIEALKAHDVQDFETFATGAMWRELEHLEIKNNQEDDLEFTQSDLTACRDSLAAIERGEYMTLEDWRAERLARRKKHSVV